MLIYVDIFEPRFIAVDIRGIVRSLSLPLMKENHGSLALKKTAYNSPKKSEP